MTFRCSPNAARDAARADVPFQHAFENWLRALLGATARAGSRVALYGDGGDQLFAVSTVFLRDLFGSLKWRELRREWRAFGGGGARALWNYVARPVVAERVRAVRGKSGPQTSFPDWVSREFVATTFVGAAGGRSGSGARNDEGGQAATETRRSLGNPMVTRVSRLSRVSALEHGVELRAPLFDRRIVRVRAAASSSGTRISGRCQTLASTLRARRLAAKCAGARVRQRPECSRTISRDLFALIRTG